MEIGEFSFVDCSFSAFLLPYAFLRGMLFSPLLDFFYGGSWHGGERFFLCEFFCFLRVFMPFCIDYILFSGGLFAGYSLGLAVDILR
jgi:hypothetical protein